MKKFLLILFLLVVLVAGGLVTMIVMSFNPTAYEKEVVAYLQKLTGREVTVGGSTSVSWNPVPTVTMNDLRIGNIDKSEHQTMLSIEKVQVSIAWDSLLKSPLEITRVELMRPVLVLERLGSNRANFAFPFLLDPNFQLQETALLAGDSSKTTKINSVIIKEGTIRYANQVTGVSAQINGVNGTLAVDSVRGPFRFEGSGISDQGQYKLTASVGAFQSGGAVPVRVQLVETGTKSDMSLSGDLTPSGADRWFTGAAQFNVGRLDSLLSLMTVPAPEVAIGASAGGSFSLEVGPVTDTLKDFVIQIGEGDRKAAFTGTISRILSGKTPRYSVSLATDLFRPEQWESYLNTLNWGWLSGAEVHPDITFKLLANAMPYHGAEVKDVTLDGRYENGELNIEKASVSLPNNGTAVFNVLGKTVGQAPVLEFGIRAEVSSVQNGLKLIFPDETWAAVSALDQKGNLTGRISWTPDQATLTLNNFKIGDTVVQGSVQKKMGESVSYVLNIALSNINIDTYTGWKAFEKPVALSDLPGIIKGAFEGASWANGPSVQGQLDIQDAIVFGLPASRIHLDAALDKGGLRVDALTVQNMATANLSAIGAFSGIGRPQMNVDGLQLSLETKQLPLLLEKLRIAPTIPLIQQATNASFKLGLKGGRDSSWETDVQTALSDANIRLNGVLETPETNPTIRNMGFEITHPNFQTFMKLVEPGFNWVPRLDGTFKATGKLSGTKDHFEFQDTTIGIGLQQLSGSLSFDNRQIKTLTAEIASPSLDLERFISDIDPYYSSVNGASLKALDLSALNNWNMDVKLSASQLIYSDLNIRQAEVETKLQNKELSLIKLTGQSGASEQSPIEVTGKLDWNTTPTLTSMFDIKNIPLRSDFMVLPDFAFGGGTLSVSGELKARGNSPAEFIQNLNGQGSISIRGGQMMHVDVEAMIPIITRAVQRNDEAKILEPEFKRVLSNGKTVLQSIKGDYVIANGIVRMMDLTLDTANATANPTQVIWDIPKRTLDVSVPVVLKPLNTLPPFILGISASVGRGMYKANYADLLSSLSNQSQTALANDLRRREEAAKTASLQKRSERLAESQRLTREARLAVESMEQRLKEFPFEKGRRLLAGAKDALVLVNQGAVREEPTDAQLIQQIEQARMVLLRAEEFDRTLEKETVFNTQSQVKRYHQMAERMTAQLKEWAAANPGIVILARLADNAEQNRQIIEARVGQLTPDVSSDQAALILSACAEATAKIEKAYQHAQRFDLRGISRQASESPLPVGEHKAVKGSFKRSE